MTTTKQPGVTADFLTLLKDDAYAMSFQSMGQYRTALIEAYGQHQPRSSGEADRDRDLRQTLGEALSDELYDMQQHEIEQAQEDAQFIDWTNPENVDRVLDRIMPLLTQRVEPAKPVVAWMNPFDGAILHDTSKEMCKNRRKEWIALCALTPPAAPSVTAEAVEGWTFKEFPDGKFLAQQADGSGAVVTDDSQDGIAQCILARLIKDILTQRAGTDGEAKDAARYRKLRAQQWQTSHLFVVRGSRDAVRLGTYCPSFELLDEEVDALPDAAMGGETK